jgi:DNA-binding Xre family transcriptional regulator
MEDEINHILSRAESKFCAPNGSRCTSKTVGLLVRRHIVADEFHFIGKEASTRWAGGPDPSMLADAGALDPADETCREYERVVDAKYLDQIRTEAKQFSNKLLSRQSGVARSAIMNFKKGKNTIKFRTLRKLTKAIHALQNSSVRD